MTASVGQTFVGTALQRSTTQQSDARTGEDSPAFGELLAHEKTPGKERMVHGEKTRADFAVGKAGEQPDAAGLLANDEAVAGPDGKGKRKQATDDETTDADDRTAGLRDRLPLMMALHGLNRAQADGKDQATDPNASAGNVDPDSISKLMRTNVARQQKADGTVEEDGEQAPKLQIDKSTQAMRSADGASSAAMAGKTDSLTNLPAEGNADPVDATLEAAGTGGSQPAQVDPLSVENDGHRSSSAVLKQSGAARASVVSEQNFPAPASQAVSQTARDVIDAIAASGKSELASPTPAAANQNGASVAVPAHVLKIELHPAELGAVTANLRLAGEQLSIELRPETHEAHRRLSSDSETIVKSLKALGFDIDKVTILQPSIAATPAARVDATANGASAGRDQSSFQPGGSGSNGDGMGGQQSGRNHGDERHQDQRQAQSSRQNSGSGLFI